MDRKPGSPFDDCCIPQHRCAEADETGGRGKVPSASRSMRTRDPKSNRSFCEVCTFSCLLVIGGIPILQSEQAAESCRSHFDPHWLPQRSNLARFIHEGAQGGLWGDEITPNMMASGRFWLYDGVGELVGF